MKTNEIKEMIVNVCRKLIIRIAQKHGVLGHELNIRIDMKDVKSKPVFGLFHHSKFLSHTTLVDIIRASGGMALNFLIQTQIKNLIRDIFINAVKRYALNQTSDLFVLMYMKEENDTKIPMLAIYKHGELMDAVEIGEIMEGIDPNIQT
jgi:hypothetical protein